jgi:hypothetical protein
VENRGNEKIDPRTIQANGFDKGASGNYLRSVGLKTLKTGVNIMPLVARTHRLVSHSLTTGSAAIGQPALAQAHCLDAVGLTVRAVAPFGRNSAEIDFTTLLIGIISTSLDRRTRSILELTELGKTFGVSKSRSIVLREQVIDRLDARAWIRGGAPRRNRIELQKASKAGRRQVSQRKV